MKNIQPIPTLEIWKLNTDAGVFAPRREKMLEIDALIKQYETASSGGRIHILTKLYQTFQEYKTDPKHISWKTQPRNKRGMLSQLDDTLNFWHEIMMPKIPDPSATDAMYGRNGFIEADHVHSRLGIIWLFANTSIVGEDPEPEDVKDPILTGPDQREWYQKIWDALVEFCRNTQQRIMNLVQKGKEMVSVEALKGYPKKGLAIVKDYIRESVSLDPNTSKLPSHIYKLLKKLMTTILGTIGGPIIDVARGLIAGIGAAWDRYQVWDAQKNVDISAGTPATIVEAIKTAMDRSIAEGLLGAIKGGLGLLTGPLASIVNEVAGVLEKVCKFLLKAWEKAHLKAFIADAKQLWEERQQETPFHAKAEVFNNWFKSYVNHAPAIAMLALNSGCCGHKMVWLNMMNTSGIPNTQGQFDAGVKFLDEHLMAYGSSYLGNYDIEFTSTDKVAEALIKNAAQHAVITKGQTARRVIDNLLGGDTKALVQRVFPGAGVPAV